MLQRNRDALVGQRLTSWSVGRRDRAAAVERRTFWQQKLQAAQVDPADQDGVVRVLSDLFPEIQAAFASTNNYTTAADRSTPKAISDPDYFDRYVSFGVPEDDVPDSIIEEGLTDLGRGPTSTAPMMAQITATRRAAQPASDAERQAYGVVSSTKLVCLSVTPPRVRVAALGGTRGSLSQGPHDGVGVEHLAACGLDNGECRGAVFVGLGEDRESELTLRAAGIGALLVSIGAGMTSNLLFLAAFQFRLDWFREPTGVLGAGATSAELLRWASVLDLIGYYLATAVLAYVLWRLLRPRNSLIADLSALAAVGYALAGGVGAAVLAVVAPMLMHDYVAAATADRVLIAAQFAVLFEVVWRAIWQFLDGVLLAAWWLGIGALIRGGSPGLSRLSVALAAAAAIGGVVNVLGFGLARDVMLGVVFTLWTAWWIWLLVRFVRSSPAAANSLV